MTHPVDRRKPDANSEMILGLLEEGRHRMDVIESELKDIAKTARATAGLLDPRGVVAKVAGVVVTVLMGLCMSIAWFLADKNTDLRRMQDVLAAHSAAITETVSIVKALVESDRRQQDRIDKNTDLILRDRK